MPACPGTCQAGGQALPALLTISTEPALHQPHHAVQKGDYEIERDYRNGKDEEYRFIASRTAVTVKECGIDEIM